MVQWNEREQVSSQGSPAGSRGLIYVVDDEVMLLELATIILEPRGYTVRTFRDPTSALAAFTAAKPRPILVITDYAMHSMNGMALIAACRRVEPDQKMLLISGTVAEDIYQDSPCKPDAFVAKPYHARQLIEKVESMVAT
jgi:DNA-binding NtrC family response regulator